MLTMNSHCQPARPPTPLMCRLPTSSVLNRQSYCFTEGILHPVCDNSPTTIGNHVAEVEDGEPLAGFVSSVKAGDGV